MQCSRTPWFHSAWSSAQRVGMTESTCFSVYHTESETPTNVFKPCCKGANTGESTGKRYNMAHEMETGLM